MTDRKLIVSSSPHISVQEGNRGIMADVLIALAPAVIASGFFFGFRAYLIIIVAVCSCVVSEFLYQCIYRGFDIKNKKNTTLFDALSISKQMTDIGDMTAVVTGVLLAMNMPVTIPLWMVIIGSAFAIIIVKQLFGGLGNNFVNPALAARAFMLACWGAALTSKFVAPVMNFGRFVPVSAVSSATPLAFIRGGEAAGDMPEIYDLFVGGVGGCIGETSAFLLIIGGIYLILRGVIDWKIPLCYLGSFGLMVYLFGGVPHDINFVMYNMFAGGLMLGAFFMATDYVTTPTTGAGHMIFGLGCGIITFVIRRFGGYPEGVSYAILLMNVVAPLIDKLVMPKRFGKARFGKVKAERTEAQ